MKPFLIMSQNHSIFACNENYNTDFFFVYTTPWKHPPLTPLHTSIQSQLGKQHQLLRPSHLNIQNHAPTLKKIPLCRLGNYPLPHSLPPTNPSKNIPNSNQVLLEWHHFNHQPTF
jgi:hypothetical protein